MNRDFLLNLSLLVVTLSALAVAAYGFSRTGGQLRTSEIADAVNVNDKTDQLDTNNHGHGRRKDRPSRTKSTEKDVPDHSSFGTEHDNINGLSTTRSRTVKADPSDSGNASISGIVVDLTGKAIAGAIVRARNTDFSEPYPEHTSCHMIQASRWVAYAAAFERQTRDAMTDSEGRFNFTGLDEAKSYRIWAFTPDTAAETLERVAAGDSTVRIVLGARQILRGVVTDEAGKPVRNFNVLVGGRAATWFNEQRTFSSPDGRFSMPVSIGAVTVVASAYGFTLSEAKKISFDGRDRIAEITLVLRAGATLSGTVTDLTGAPLAGVAIEINRPSDNINLDRWSSSRIMSSGEHDSSSSVLDFSDDDSSFSFKSGTFPEEYVTWLYTDSRGRYKLEGLIPDEYMVRAACGEASKTETVQVKPQITTQDFQLDAGVRVEIRVVGPDGQPADPSSVSLRTESNDFARSHTLPRREPGLVELSGFAAGTYVLHVTCDGYPHIARKESFKSGEPNKVSVVLQKPAYLSGRITGAGKTPTGTVGIAWLTKEGETITAYQGRHCQIDAAGNYLLGPVEAGEWTFSINDNGVVRHKARTQIKEGDNFLDLVLDTRGILRVRLQNEDGKPYALDYSISISVTDAAETTRYMRLGTDGIATLSFIEPGECTVTAQLPGRGPTSIKTFVREGVNDLTFVMKATIGYRITSVIKDSQAEQIGLKYGDIIVAYNSHKITGEADLRSRLSEASSDTTVSMAVTRDGVMMTFTLKGGPIGIYGQDAVP